MKVRRGLTSALLAATLLGCTGADERKLAHLQRGETLFAQGNFEKARVEYKNALQIDPEDADAHFRLGLTLESLQRWRDAARRYQRVLSIEPGHLEGRVRLARILTAARETEPALAEIASVLEADPRNPEALGLRAALRLDGGDTAGAISDAQAAVALAPERTDLAGFLVSVLGREGRLDEAHAVATAGLVASPESPVLLELLARIEAQRGDLARAAALLTRILRRHPGDARIARMLASVKIQGGELERAREVLETAAAAEPAALEPKLALLDFLARHLGREAATASTRRFIAAAPDVGELRFALARIEALFGDTAAAKQVLRESIATYGNSVAGLRARYLLATQFAAERDLQAAAALAAEVLAVNPLDADTLRLRGALSLARNDPGTAILDLRTLLRDRPDDRSGRLLLARAHALNNERDQARDLAQRAVEADPDDVEARFFLLALLGERQPGLRQRVIEETVALLDARLAANAGDVGALVELGRLRLNSGQAVRAIQDLRTAVSLDTTNPEAYRLLARAEVESGDAGASAATLREAALRNPEDIRTQRDYAASLAATGALEEALATVDASLGTMPNDLELLRQRADILRASGGWEQLATTGRQIQRVAPERPLGFYVEGIALQASGQVERSVDALNRAAERSPNAVEPLTALARGYFARDEPEEALRILNRGLAQAADNLAALNLRGEVLLQLDRFAEADESFRRALEIRPQWSLPQQNLARSRLAQGDEEGALRAFTEAQAIDPKNLAARYRLAALCERLGDLELAVAEYGAIVESWPKEIVAKNNLAMLLVREEIVTDATLERALELVEGFASQSRPELLDTLAWVHLARGEPDKALKILRSVVENAPRVAVYRFHLAMAQLRSGDTHAARANLELSLSDGPSFEGRAEAEAALARLRG